MLASPLCDGPGFVREKYEFLGQKVGFLFCPIASRDSFSPKDGLDHLVSGWSRSSPTPYLGFQGLRLSPPFFGRVVGWSGFWGGDFLGVGEIPQESMGGFPTETLWMSMVHEWGKCLEDR